MLVWTRGQLGFDPFAHYYILFRTWSPGYIKRNHQCVVAKNYMVEPVHDLMYSDSTCIHMVGTVPQVEDPEMLFEQMLKMFVAAMR